MIEKLDFGRFAAEADILQEEPEVFVIIRQSKAFQLPQHRIIIGRKGIGKTALQQEFSRNYQSKYDFLLYIDAEVIRFRKLIDIYRLLESEAGGTIELKKAITNIWEYSILTNCMILLLEKINTFKGSGAVIHNFLRKEGLLKKRIYDLLIDRLEGLFQMFSIQKGKAASEIIRSIDNYPLDTTEFKDACVALQEVLRDSKGILVTFDRIDTYFEVEARPYERDIVERHALRNFLAGLVQSVYNISISPLGRSIEFKVFLPEDKYKAIRSRDLDKIKEFVFKINWTPPELKEFIARRIAHSLDIRDRDGNLCVDIDNTWYKVFPRTVTNERVSGIPEDIVEYLIRHTHYRPRDLQYYCAKAKELALSEVTTKPIKISEEIIRRAVRGMTKELVDNFFIEFAYEYPFIKRLIECFRKALNIMSYTEEFFPHINRFASREKMEYTPDELVNLLFDVGFVGGMTSKRTDLDDFAPTRKVKGKTYSFYFSHIDPTYDVRDSDSVAIHPIFNEYLHLEISPEIIVG